ncbi:MAG: HDIG domain-containing protein [Bacteroidales bacterium]|nr:HDIG domain-containing protein [Bacteroidales bacterium]
MKKQLKYLQENISNINKLILFLVSALFLVLLLPKEVKFKYEYIKGRPWEHHDLTAPFNFAIQKSVSELNQEQAIIKSEVPLYLVYNNDKTEAGRQRAKLAFKQGFQEKYGQHTHNYQINFNLFESLYDTILNTGIVGYNSDLEELPKDASVNLIRNNIAFRTELNKLFNIKAADEFITNYIEQQINRNLDHAFILTSIRDNLFQNVNYDAELSKKALNERLGMISLTRGMVQEGEYIIRKAEIVNANRFQILESLKDEYQTRLGDSSRLYYLIGGQIILVLIILIIFFAYMLLFRFDIAEENKNMVLILLISGLMISASTVLLKYEPELIYAFPFCLTAVMVRAFFDNRLALFVHTIMILFVSFIMPNSFEFIFLQYVAGIITIISIQQLQNRSQFFLTSIWIFIAYSISYVGLLMIQEGSFDNIIWMNFAFYGISGMLIMFSYPLIYLFEKLFGKVTDVTLLELSNTNRKLLRDLASDAPGTFQHSMQVANLAEAGIYEIGGNPLLVRTGALYHDIGKMNSPLFFTENQSTGINPHDELSFDESARIVVNHVISGIEKAKKYRLPEPIIDFIRTHHGTRKAEYFFLMQKKENPEEIIDENDYIYPGPKPFSKETAVFMMADSVEAASRSLKFPDEQNIMGLINNIVNKQLDDGQFDNANITLRDISRVKRVFKEKLMNIYHARIAYPTEK